MPKRTLKEKLYVNRKRGRPRKSWIDDVDDDLRKMKIRGWKEKMNNRGQWRLIAEEAKAHPEL